MKIWPLRRKRDQRDVAISTLDAIAFVAIHGNEEDAITALHAYRAFHREAKAGRLETLEMQMKVVAREVGKQLEQELLAKRERGL